MQWFKFFVEMAPFDLRQRFRTAHILNCNIHMQRFLRKLYNICSGTIKCYSPQFVLLTSMPGIYSVEVRTHFSLEDLCESVHSNLTTTLTNACTWFPCNLLNLTSIIASAGALEQETKETFKDVMLRQAHLMKAPVNLFIAQSHLRIDSVSTQNGALPVSDSLNR